MTSFGGNLNYRGIKGSSIRSTWGYPIESIDTGGEGEVLSEHPKKFSVKW